MVSENLKWTSLSTDPSLWELKLGKIGEIITQQPHQSNQQLRLLIIPWWGYLWTKNYKYLALLTTHQGNSGYWFHYMKIIHLLAPFSWEIFLHKVLWQRTYNQKIQLLTAKLYNILMVSILSSCFVYLQHRKKNGLFPTMVKNSV